MTQETEVAVAMERLAGGQRFRVVGLGNRCGVLLRLTELSAVVAYDKQDGTRRTLVAISLSTKVIPLDP